MVQREGGEGAPAAEAERASRRAQAAIRPAWRGAERRGAEGSGAARRRAERSGEERKEADGYRYLAGPNDREVDLLCIGTVDKFWDALWLELWPFLCFTNESRRIVFW